jgi:hypothetical protein
MSPSESPLRKLTASEIQQQMTPVLNRLGRLLLVFMLSPTPEVRDCVNTMGQELDQLWRLATAPLYPALERKCCPDAPHGLLAICPVTGES